MISPAPPLSKVVLRSPAWRGAPRAAAYTRKNLRAAQLDSRVLNALDYVQIGDAVRVSLQLRGFLPKVCTMPTLEFVSGPDSGRCVLLSESETTSGRSPFCDIVVDSHAISRQHVRFVRAEGEVYIEDLESLNGTFVNGERIRGRTQLEDQDLIQLPQCLMLFHAGAVTKATSASRAARMLSASSKEKPQHGQRGTTGPNLPPAPPRKKKEDETSGVNQDDTAIRGGIRDTAKPVTKQAVLLAPDRAQARLKALLTMSSSVGKAQGPEDLYAAILEGMLAVFPHCDSAYLLLPDAVNAPFALRAAKNRDPKRPVRETLPPWLVRLAVQAAKARRPVLVKKTVRAEVPQANLPGEGPVGTAICLPLFSNPGLARGIAYLQARTSGGDFLDSDLELAQSVSGLVGLALQLAHDCE